MARVLVIGERPEQASALAFRLGLLNHESSPSASELTLALRSLITFQPDIVVLDARKSKRSRELFRILAEVSETPIIVLTGDQAGSEAVRYLEAGAADCMTRPISPNLISARIAALLRSANRHGSTASINVNGLDINLDRRLVLKHGKLISLTPIEFRLLESLARSAGKVCGHEALLRDVWGEDFVECSHYLRLYIGYLRHKLEDNPAAPKYIVTAWGRGYRLVFDDAAKAPAAARRVRPAAA